MSFEFPKFKKKESPIEKAEREAGLKYKPGEGIKFTDLLKEPAKEKEEEPTLEYKPGIGIEFSKLAQTPKEKQPELTPRSKAKPEAPPEPEPEPEIEGGRREPEVLPEDETEPEVPEQAPKPTLEPETGPEQAEAALMQRHAEIMRDYEGFMAKFNIAKDSSLLSRSVLKSIVPEVKEGDSALFINVSRKLRETGLDKSAKKKIISDLSRVVIFMFLAKFEEKLDDIQFNNLTSKGANAEEYIEYISENRGSLPEMKRDEFDKILGATVSEYLEKLLT